MKINLEQLFLEYNEQLMSLHLLTKNLVLKYDNCIDDTKVKSLHEDIDNRQRLINLIEKKYQLIVSTINQWHQKQIHLNNSIKTLEEQLIQIIEKNKNHFKQQIILEKKYQTRGAHGNE